MALGELTVPVPASPPAEVHLGGRRLFADRAFHAAVVIAGAVVLGVLALIAWSTTQKAWPAFTDSHAHFFTSSRWSVADGRFGALAFVYGSLVTAAIALAIAVPVSLGIALFVTQVAPVRLRRPVIYTVDLLAVVPSVVFGLWGLIYVKPAVEGFYRDVSDATSGIPVLRTLFAGPTQGLSFFTAGLILAIMIIPIITSLAREVIDTTPPGEREAALALGATRWEMIKGSVLPHSRSGLVGAVMLGFGRAMGETIAAALVIGASPQVTAKLFGAGYSMPSVIANEFGEAEGVHRAALVGLGVVLFLITIVVNLSASAITSRADRRARGA